MSIFDREQQGDPNKRARAAIALNLIFAKRGPYATRARVIEATLQHTADLDILLLCQLHQCRAELHNAASRRLQAITELEQALGIIHEQPTASIHIEICRALASAGSWSKQTDKARHWLDRAMQYAETLGRPELYAPLWYDRGRVQEQLGQYDLSKQSFQKTLENAVQCGDKSGEAFAHYSLGFSNLNRGQPDTSEEHFNQAVMIYESLEDRRSEGLRAVRALLALDRGEPDRAEIILRRSIVFSQRSGIRHMQAEDLQWLGLTAQMQGKLEEAATYYEDSAAIFEELGRGVQEKYNRCLLAGVLGVHDDPEYVSEELEAAIYAMTANIPLDIAGLRLTKAIMLERQAQAHDTAGRPERATTLRKEIDDLFAVATSPLPKSEQYPDGGPIPVHSSVLVRLLHRYVTDTLQTLRATAQKP